MPNYITTRSSPIQQTATPANSISFPAYSPPKLSSASSLAPATSSAPTTSHNGHHYVTRPTNTASNLTSMAQHQRQNQAEVKELTEEWGLEVEIVLGESKIQFISTDDHERQRNEAFFAMFSDIIKKTVVEGKMAWELDSSQYANYIQRNALLDNFHYSWYDCDSLERNSSAKALIDFKIDFSRYCLDNLLDSIDYSGNNNYQSLRHKEHVDIFVSSDSNDCPLIKKAQEQNFGTNLPCIAKETSFRRGIRLTYKELLQFIKEVIS